MKKRNSLFILTSLWCLISLAACGGGGSSSTSDTDDDGTDSEVTGLEIADEVSLVEAQDVPTTRSSLPTRGVFGHLAALITTDETTPYYTDPLDVWTYDDSMQSLDIINEILCSFNQTAYDEMVNQGDYIALIDNALCARSEDQSGSQNNQSTGANAEELETWIVNSSRTDNDSDQIVMAWIIQAETEYDPASVIHAKTTITEAVSEDNPFGSFRIDFAMMDETETVTLAQGYLETVDNSDESLVEFQFSMTGDEDFFPVSEATHLIMTADGSEGTAYTAHSYSSDMGSESSSYNVAYDDAHYYTEETVSSETRCLDRTDFSNKVFRYGVYTEAGARLDIDNPGFGIRYTDDSDNVTYGWAGYHGIWLPESIDLISGLEVERANNDESSGAIYTTVVAPGKLVLHTKSEITLDDIENDDLSFWDNANSQNLRVHWNGSVFIADGEMTCGDSGCNWTDTAETELDLNADTMNSWLYFWRDGLGSLTVENLGDEITGDTAVALDTMQVLTAADLSGAALTLNCFQQCLQTNLTSDQLNWNGDDPYFDESSDLADPYIYTIDPSDMTLRYGADPVAPSAEVTSVEGQNSWGVQSGPMVTDAVLALLTDTWEVWGQETYYTWETGPNNWNQFTGLLDSDGNAVEFDAPINLSYTHEETGDRYILQFNGFGDLYGLPWVQAEGEDRWYPAITIPDGSTVTGDDNTVYYVRALEMEQRMEEVDASACSDLTLEELTVPDAEYVDPAIGAMPTVTDDPAVIKGDLTSS